MLAAVRRPVDAPLGIGSIRMPEHGDKDPVGIARVDNDSADLLSVSEAHVPPGLAGVGRFVDSITGGEVGALQSLASTDVDYVGVGRSNGERADRAGWLIVKDGPPGAAKVVGPPHTAVVDAYVEEAGMAGNAGCADSSASAKWADHAPLHFAVEFGAKLLRRGWGRAQQEQESAQGQHENARYSHIPPPKSEDS